MDQDLLPIGSRDTLTDTPEVGMGASYAVGSDSYPATVVAVNGTTVTLRKDSFDAVSGPRHWSRTDTAQEWRVYANPKGGTFEVRRAKDGRWLVRTKDYPVVFGWRSVRRDPSR